MRQIRKVSETFRVCLESSAPDQSRTGHLWRRVTDFIRNSRTKTRVVETPGSVLAGLRCLRTRLEHKQVWDVNLLLTGRPGIGKTSAIMRALELLEGRVITGFYTRELRGPRGRLGFEAVTLDGRRQTLAHVEFRGRHRVSRYGVDVASFEAEIVPTIDPLRHPDADLIVIDEIGKMECFSVRFQEAVLRALEAEVSVLGTVGLGRHPFIRQVRARNDVALIQVTAGNRDLLPQRLAQDCVPATSML